MSGQYASERDFIAQFILPNLRRAADTLGISDVMKFAVDKKIHNLVMDLDALRTGNPVFVLEAKFKKGSGKFEIDIEPRDPEVVDQAVHYAALGGYPYYITCNTKRLILYKFQPGVGAFESETAAFDYSLNPDWAEKLLGITLGIIKAEPKPPDNALVDMFAEAYYDLYPQFLDSLKSKLENQQFANIFVDWIKRQGLELSDDTVLKIASQATYMELNKILFYHVIRLIYPEKLDPLKIELHMDVSGALKNFWKSVKDIDYAPIYESTIISEIPFTNKAEARVRTLLDTLNNFDFGKMESDFLGHIYEKLIPPIERKRLGQFYTPPGIIDLIIELTIQNENENILDPGCGSGGFLVGAYQKLRELKGFSKDSKLLLASAYHQQILEQIYGIDINQFPAHLSVINLAVQNPKVRIDQINVLVSDFFDIRPRISTLTGFQGITPTGDEAKVNLPAFFDVVIGNPPYIRQELLNDNEKIKIKELIEAEYRDKLVISSSNKINNKKITYDRREKNIIKLDSRSDIFVYFVIHGLKMIREGGRLGFITSNKWLEVGYGEPFQNFLLDSSKIQYIIEFDRAVFPDAEVNTCILILEKNKNKKVRESNDTKFIIVKKKMSLNDQISNFIKINTNYESENIKINKIKQKYLELGKWNIYLRAPVVFNKIKENSKVISLSNLGKVLYGIKTGYNPYFILSKSKALEIGIETESLTPCVVSPKQVKNIVIESTNDYLFDVKNIPSSLVNNKTTNYIKFGEKLDVEVKRGSKRGIIKLPYCSTVKNRKPKWYSLPQLETPDILLPKLADKRVSALLNAAKAQATDLFYYIVLKDHQDAKIITAYLNSSIGGLLGELYGRSYGGGVLDIKVFEAKKLPIVDPKKLTLIERTNIENAFDNLIILRNEKLKLESIIKANKNKINTELIKNLNNIKEKEESFMRDLNKTFYIVLNLTEKEQIQVEKSMQELQEIRRSRSKTD